MNTFFHKYLYLSLLLFVALVTTNAQTLSFNHFNTSTGLSNNNIRSITLDKNGFLWMGTDQGLNVFDGYGITLYNRERYPQLANDIVIHLFTDTRNRVWIGTFAGANWIDEKKIFTR